ncbi:MAG: hypothetical protein GXO58_02250, partial [Thermodesulfobacteria bacterium]|nr:hypothetical protein [Thermodesulfobacteriota bacterium]
MAFAGGKSHETSRGVEKKILILLLLFCIQWAILPTLSMGSLNAQPVDTESLKEAFVKRLKNAPALADSRVEV